MRQIRIGRRRSKSASWQQTTLPLDARDPDIVHAHQITRHTGRSRAGKARSAEGGSGRAAGR